MNRPALLHIVEKLEGFVGKLPETIQKPILHELTPLKELFLQQRPPRILLTGSTRLKAGTATKIALNIISTGAMVGLGKVRGNLMIDLHTSSTKLRDRAVRVVAQLAHCDYDEARERLERSGWNLRSVLNSGSSDIPNSAHSGKIPAAAS